MAFFNAPFLFVSLSSAASVTLTFTGSVFYPSVSKPWHNISWTCGGVNRTCLYGEVTYNDSLLSSPQPVTLDALTNTFELRGPAVTYSLGDTSGYPMVLFLGGTWNGVVMYSDFIVGGLNYRFQVQGFFWSITELIPRGSTMATGDVRLA